MSQKKTFVVTNGNSRIIHYRKNSPPKKSGILERHTYKTDNGEPLPGISCDSNFKQCLGSSNTVNKYTFMSNRSSQSSLMKSPNLPRHFGGVAPERMLIRSKNVNRSDNLNIVRTEHCDSTTDIDLVSKNSRRSSSKQNGSDSDISSDYNALNYKIGNKKRVFKKHIDKSYESDSDCQIVDVKTQDNPPKRKTFLHQMEWMIIANKNSQIGDVEVISDTDSDNSDLQSNTLTSSVQNHSLKSIKKAIYTSDDSIDKKEEHVEPSVYEISDGIHIVLPPKISDKNDADTKKPRIEVLSNVVVQSKKQNSTEYESESSYVTSSQMHLRDQTPPPDKNMKFNPKSPKYDLTLSPESMKTEFYSYLKINTNPLAPKVELGHQNRRSVRVKKLVEKSEKEKEKNEKLKEEETNQKRDEIRAKFLKFTPPKIQFPDLLAEKGKRSDFDKCILKFFAKEGIDYKQKEKEKTNKPENKTIPKLETSYERKLLYQKIFTKQPNTSENKTKKIKTHSNVVINNSSKIPQKMSLVQKTVPQVGRPKNIFFERRVLKQKNKGTIKNNLRRVLRGRMRITRNCLSLSQNLRKNIKMPSKAIKHKKVISKLTVSPKQTIQEPKKVEKESLNVLDRLDLISQKVMSELTQNSDTESLPEEKCDTSENSDVMQTPPTTSEQKSAKNDQNGDLDDSDNELKELESPKSPVDSCIGFKPDDMILNLRKNLATVLSNLTTNEFPGKDNINPIVLLEKGVIKTPQRSPDTEEKVIHEVYSDITSKCDSLELNIVPEIFDSASIKCDKVQNYIPLNPNVVKKSFHHSLLASPKKKSEESPARTDPLFATNSNFSFLDEDTQNSSLSTSSSPKKSRTHEIDIQRLNGPVFNAYYVNCTLIIVQELIISFWKQTPLGNILGAQNMWYSIGNIKRLTLERGCINRRSSEMVLNVDSSVAYVELWTKEHQSDYRERPVTDVFATVYYHKGHGLPDKKVLQLENIKGFGNDVRFAIMKNSREIVVSWYEIFSEPAKSTIRSYQLAPDFQTITSTKEIESVEHFILSLHNIGNCDTLVLGAGTEQISIWNLTHGWLSTTVRFDITSIQIHSMCLWAYCETGYLFLLQQIGRGILRLVAVNGVSSQYKQLQIYHVPECYESLLGVTIESGILMTCYTNGFLCYDMQSGELLTDTETPINKIILPSEKFLVSLDDFKISVKHVMVYILEN